ncbi:hypothetical protein GCM10011508_11330 [Flavobacterium lutivivi]|nr:hypothetical protein GCM10011508_11330 [Flavobacterium lutivivi]
MCEICKQLEVKSDIIYIEKSNGSSHDGEAWIGKCFYSKSGASVYFNGKVFKKGQSFSGNHFDIETGENYWISKVKKNGEDRHRFGKGKINIDQSIVNEYLAIIGEEKLQKNKFILVQLDNQPAKQKATEIENEKFEMEFNSDLRLKNLKDLTNNELKSLIEYYEGFDFPSMYKKSRKEVIEALKNAKIELEERQSNIA